LSIRGKFWKRIKEYRYKNGRDRTLFCPYGITNVIPTKVGIYFFKQNRWIPAYDMNQGGSYLCRNDKR
jgi:hypothetical protein